MILPSNIHIGISGSANLKQARAEVAKLQTQFKLLEQQVSQRVFTDRTLGLNDANRGMKALGNQFATLAAETGKWQTIQKSVNDQTVQYTSNLIKQKTALNELRSARRSGLSEIAYQEQLRLRSAQVSTVGRERNGNLNAQMMIPATAERSLDTIGNRAGFAANELRAASNQMIDFGKNTQWAGRQLTVGFTVPLMAAGAATGYFANTADKELTRIAKVYDTANTDMLSAQDAAMSKERELAQLRNDGMATAATAAKQYGAAMQDTLSVQGELAATGVRGNSLQQATNETMRLATLGEMDYQTAVQATITLQSVFRASSEELTETFNFMNAVENQTSLSMQDFATAIPVAAAPIKALGGDMQDLATLMVAMKSRGIDAAEGANAVKSAFNRLLNPGKSVQELFTQLTGRDIGKIIESTKGELIPTLQAVGESVEHLEDFQRSQVLGKLFGTYQNTRITAMLTGITEDMSDMESQVGRTIALTNESEEALADMASTELQRAQESLSGRLKRQIEVIKVQLAEIGMGFLDMAIKIAEGASKLLDIFQNLPGPVKTLLKLIVGGVAVTGPLVMLAGLATNLAGTFLKFGSSLVIAATRFKLLNRDTVLARKAAEITETALKKQTATTESLTIAVQGLSKAFRDASTSQANFLKGSGAAAAAKGPAAQSQSSKNIQDTLRLQGANRETEIRNRMSADGFVYDSSGRVRNKKGTENAGRFSNKEAVAAARGRANRQINEELTAIKAQNAERLNGLKAERTAREQQKTIINEQAAATAKAEELDAKRAVNNRVMAASGGLMTASLVASLVPLGEAGSKTEQIKNNFAQWALIAGVTLPLITNIGPAMNAISNGVGVLSTRMSAVGKGVATAGSGATTLRSRFVGAGKAALSLGGMINPWAVGIAAAAGGAYLLYQNLSKGRKEMENINDNVDGLGKILGYTPSEGASVTESGEQVKGFTQRVKEFNAEYPGFARNMKDMNLQQRLNEASLMGFKVIDTGGTIDQAKEATALALASARDITEEEANKLVMQIDFDENALDTRLRGIMQKINTAVGKDAGSNWQTPWGDYGDSDARAAGSGLANAINESISNGDFAGAEDALKEVIGRINKFLESNSGYGANKFVENFVQSFGIATGREKGEVEKYFADLLSGDVKPGDVNTDMFRELIPELQAATQQQEQMVRYQQVLNSLKNSEKNSQSQINTYMQVTGRQAYGMLQTLQEQYAAGKRYKDLTAEQKAFIQDVQATTGMRLVGEQGILNLLLQQNSAISAQDQAISGAIDTHRQGITKALQQDIEGLDAAFTKRGENLETAHQNRMESMEAGNQARMDAMEQGHQNRMDAMDEAQKKREAQLERQQDKMEARHEREQKRFDSRWDGRINKLKKEEEVRQRLFDAERNRIRRMADLQNANTDFNAALRTGDLDEAARVQTTMRSQTEQNQLDDLDERLGLNAEKRIEKLEKQRVKAEDRLRKHQDIEKKALDATKKRYSDSVAAARQAAQRQYDEARKSAQRSYEASRNAAQKGFEAQKKALENEKEARKKNLSAAIEALNSFQGTSKAKWIAHLKDIREKFNLYGGRSGKAFGDRAGSRIEQLIEKAIRDAGKDKDNKSAGKSSAENWYKGAGSFLKLSQKDLKKFAKNHWSTGQGGSGGLTVNHTGGFPGGVKGRVGYPSSASPYPSEHLALLKNDEFVVRGQATRKYGPDAMRAINDGTAEVSMHAPHARHKGGYGAVAKFQGRMINEGMTKHLATLVYAQRAAQAATDVLGGMPGLGGIAGLGKVDPKGWNKPWKGSYSTNNGHDYPLSYAPLYAPHSGRVTSHAIRGYEGRVGHGGRGFKSYGQWVDFQGGGVNLMFAHLSKLPTGVGKSKKVRAGQPIGVTGETGNAHGPHVHVEVNRSGNNHRFGQFFRQRGVSLRKGGTLKYDNTAINGHKGETVLTDNLTKKFKDGITEFASGGGNRYDISVTMNGTASREDKNDLTKMVMDAIDLKESRKGKKR